VRGLVDGERVAILTGGLVDEATEVELWVDAATGHVAECRFEVETDDGTSRWALTLDDIGEPVTIERPELGATG
jgi:hypothetical protein